MSIDSDIDLFFEDGDDAVLKRAGGDVPFKCYLDNQKTDPESQGISFPGYKIVLICPTAPVEDVAKDEIIEIGRKQYRVLNPVPDGTGVSEITLQEAE